MALFQDTFEEQQTFPVCRLYIEAHVPHILNQVDDSGLATNEGTTEMIFRVPEIKPTTCKTMWILLTLRYIYHSYIALSENHFVKHAVLVGHFVWKNPALIITKSSYR